MKNKILMLGSAIALLSSVNSFAADKKHAQAPKDNSRYIVAVNSMPKNSRPYIIFGIKNLTKQELKNFLHLASTPSGLGQIIEKRGAAGIYTNIADTHVTFGSLSKTEGDMDYKTDAESGVRYSFHKNEIKISIPEKDKVCSYDLKRTNEKIWATNGYIIKNIPSCFNGNTSYPYAIYITASKE